MGQVQHPLGRPQVDLARGDGDHDQVGDPQRRTQVAFDLGRGVDQHHVKAFCLGLCVGVERQAGGVGAVEAALIGGLAAFGVPTAIAVPSVLLYRVLTCWLPVFVGWPVMRWLTRNEMI